MNQTHLVTGGCGFLGNLIARRLHDRGDTVKVLDIWRDESLPAEIEYIDCDIRDKAGVLSAMKGVDTVHHNVALVPLTKSGRKFRDVNVIGSQIAAECAVKSGVGSFIHMSSSAIYGIPESCPITTETAVKPVEIYGSGKLAGEQAVVKTLENTDVRLVVIRPRTILGQGRLGIFQILFEWISDNRSIYTIGPGDGLFQFVHADDLMDAYLLALDQNKPGVYNVGTDRFGTLKEALVSVISHAQSRSSVKALPASLTIHALRILDWLHLSPLAPWHYLTYHKPFHFDVTPLIELGWEPGYSNNEMLSESWDWFVANRGNQNQSGGGSVHRNPVKQKILRLLKAIS